MPPSCRLDGCRTKLPPTAFLTPGSRAKLHWAAGEGGGPGSGRELWLTFPFLVETRHRALSDLSPLPVLEGLGLSQLQKRAGGYLAMDE